MAKVSLTKLGLKTNQDIKTLVWNDQTIEIKQYLPVEQKTEIISTVMDISYSENKYFANPLQQLVYLELEILYAYTNINFTDKQKEDAAKLYDLFTSTGLMQEILNNIPEEEYEWLTVGLKKTSKSVYAYQNSFVGSVAAINNDYSATKINLEEIQNVLKDPEIVGMVKGIIQIP